MQIRDNSITSLFWRPRHRYVDSYDQMRARVTLVYAAFSFLGSLLVLVISALLPRTGELPTDIFLGAILFGVVPSLLLIAFVHLGYLRPAILITYLLFLGIGAAGLRDGVASSVLLGLALPTIYGALMWQGRGIFVGFVVEAVMVIGAAILQSRQFIVPSVAFPTDQITAQAFLDLVLLIALGFISGVAASELRRAFRIAGNLVAQLRATSEVAQRTASYADLNELIQQTVNYIRDRFAFYHVQIFLNDPEQRYTNLSASTAEVGERLLKRGYRLAIGSPGIIGQAALLGESLVRTSENEPDVPSTAPGDEWLPQTGSELALPLITHDHIIGVLHIQSTRLNAFSQEDVDSLGILASHVSITISNAQLFQEQRNALNDNRRMFLEAEASLRDIQLLNQRLTGEGWQDYLRMRGNEVVGYTLMDEHLRTDPTWTPGLEEAVGKRQPVITDNGDRRTISVPVELRGRAIGAIEVETNGSARQSDTLEMLQSVAQRLALSIDNARLFEQTQDLAQQELQVNAISAKLQGVTNMNELVKIAISELGRALGAKEASIRLGMNLPAALSASSENRLKGSGQKEIAE